ncbi:GtrA family protein [Enemella evansiae]|nr:GtrA family protein [Enemella evansiae]
MSPGPRRTTAANTFARLTARMHRSLPRGLRWIPATGLGFCILGLTTFAFDLVLLSIFKSWLHMSYPLAVTLGYLGASILNFILNKWLNFRSHGHVASQSSKQLVVVVSNYVIWILGFSTLLDHLGVQYQVARVVAACIEGVYIYLLMNLWVFPEHASERFRNAWSSLRGRRRRQSTRVA